MRITCPECSAAYEVPPERMPPGRGVRCARCGGTWTPVALIDAEPALVVVDAAPVVAARAEVASPLADAAVLEAEPPIPAPTPALVEVHMPEPAAPLPEPVLTEPVPPAAARRRGIPVGVGWALTVAVLAGLGWGLVTQRAEVVRRWPPSERAYAVVGLAP